MSIRIISSGSSEGRPTWIVRRKLGVHPRQIQNRIDPANQMIGRNHVIEMELIEQLALIALQPPHHSQPPPAQVVRGRNQCSPKTATDFCNKILSKRTGMWLVEKKRGPESPLAMPNPEMPESDLPT